MRIMRAIGKSRSGGGGFGAMLARIGLALAFAALALAMLEGAVMRGAPAGSRLAHSFQTAHSFHKAYGFEAARHPDAAASFHGSHAAHGAHLGDDGAESPAPVAPSALCCPLACSGLAPVAAAGPAPPGLVFVSAPASEIMALPHGRDLEPPTPPPRFA
jgi:hypothetical protein